MIASLLRLKITRVHIRVFFLERISFAYDIGRQGFSCRENCLLTNSGRTEGINYVLFAMSEALIPAP